MNEIKRMQQLAGLNEAFINAPNNSIPSFIDEDSPRAQILVNVYYIEEWGGAIIEPELGDNFQLEAGDYLYIEKGEHGWYDGQAFESEDENTVYVNEKYIKYI